MAIIPFVRANKRPDDSLTVGPRPKFPLAARRASILRLLLVARLITPPLGRHLARRVRTRISVKWLPHLTGSDRPRGTDVALRADLVVSSLARHRPTDPVVMR